MQFLYPTYLWGFILVLIPVIIHLFQLRKYRLVYFSSLKFLKQLDIEQRRRSRLKDLLLLLVRILLISSLVLAFAHPYFPGKRLYQESGQTVGIYIDNSPSMENEADGQSIFDRAKRTAIDRIRELPADTRFYLLHNQDTYESGSPKEQKDIISAIELLRLSSHSADLGIIIERFLQILADNEDRASSMIIFSDFQQSFIKPHNLPDSIYFPVRLNSLPSLSYNNIFIDSCWFESPVHSVENRHSLHARINNLSDQDLNRFPVHLHIRDSLVAQETVTLGPYSSSEIAFSFNIDSEGWQEGRIEIRDYPVSFDNNFYFSYFISDKIPVLQIFSNSPNTNLEALFESDPFFTYSSAEAGAIPYQDLGVFRLILFNSPENISSNLKELLENYVVKGGNLIVLPPEDTDPGIVNNLMEELDAPVFGGIVSRQSEARIPPNMRDFYNQVSLNPDEQVEWPVFSKYYRILKKSSLSSSLLTTKTGSPLLTRSSYGKGFVSLSASPLKEEFTNFQVHPLFIPFLYYLANTGLEDQKLYYRIGRLEPVSIDIENNPQRGSARIREKEGDYDAIPNQAWDQVDGRLKIYLGSYSGGSGILELARSEGTEALIAMNYPTEESDINCLSVEEMNELIRDNSLDYLLVDHDLSEERNEGNKPEGRSLSFVSLLLLLAIILLLAESLIHRLKA